MTTFFQSDLKRGITYIVVFRNPTTGSLLSLMNEENDSIREFKDEDDAYEAAKNNPACRTWGAEIVPILREKLP